MRESDEKDEQPTQKPSDQPNPGKPEFLEYECRAQRKRVWQHCLPTSIESQALRDEHQNGSESHGAVPSYRKSSGESRNQEGWKPHRDHPCHKNISDNPTAPSGRANIIHSRKVGHRWHSWRNFAGVTAKGGNDRSSQSFISRGIGESRPNVGHGKFGKFLDDLLVRHPCREPAEHVVHGNTHATDARPPASLARFDGDDFPVVHTR